MKINLDLLFRIITILGLVSLFFCPLFIIFNSQLTEKFAILAFGCFLAGTLMISLKSRKQP